jgi:hypothetical protein
MTVPLVILGALALLAVVLYNRLESLRNKFHTLLRGLYPHRPPLQPNHATHDPQGTT